MRVDDASGALLVRLARAAIAEHLYGGETGPPTDSPIPAGAGEPQVDPAWLFEPGATFVTLTVAGRLRGCIGTLSAHRPLAADVRSNAVAAAVRDPRFSPMHPGELDQVRVEVSVLSAPEPLPVRSRTEAEAGLRPHVDGVILEAGRARGTFLPQVWEQLPTPAVFLDHLIRKARLPDGYWGPDVQLSTYTATAWHETSPSGPVEPVPDPPNTLDER